MKKLTLALMCVMSVLLIASCSKKQEEPKLPTVEFVNAGDGYVYQNTEVEPGQMVGFQVRAIANDPKDLLTSLEVKVTIAFQDQDSTFDTIIAIDKQTTYPFTVEPTPLMMPDGATLTVEAFAKTQKNQQNSAKVVVTVVSPILEVKDLSWVRDGSAAATGLEQFGLKWEKNYKGVCAKIVPLEGALLNKVLEFTFDEVQTFEEKAAAFLSGEGLEEFHEVSCDASGAIDYLLVTWYNNEYYLIHLTQTTVEPGTAAGTYKITIDGQWK